MATQSPGPPAYPDTGDAPDPALARARTEAASVLAKSTIAAINVYNDLITEARVFTPTSSRVSAPHGWTHLDALGRVRGTPRELSWAFGPDGDSLHALVYWTSGGGRALVSARRDAANGVVVHSAPTDTSSPRGRELARFFSPPLEVRLKDGRRTFEYFRLWELAPDLSTFLLYASEARVIHGNRPDVAAAYDAAVHGVPGNGSDFLLERGELGRIRANGGTGIAEFRYLETAELLTRQFMRGTAWGWRTHQPELLVDYFPQPDEALHTWLGYADPRTPGVDANARRVDATMLGRAYVLIDLRIEQLRRLSSSSPGTMLFVTGEHGMRPTWMEFRPNVVLRDAGLLSTDTAGRIDLAHTLAAATDKAWISVNLASRRGGIVPSAAADSVLSRVERALRDVRDSTGSAIVTQTWRRGTAAADSLGLGGPAGGDLYYGLAYGYYPLTDVKGSATQPMPFPKGEHGFPSTDSDMQPMFCAVGGGAVPHRYGAVRAIDIAPTVSDWLGISPPANARGASRLDDIVRVR